jgi:Glycosyl transferases group 1
MIEAMACGTPVIAFNRGSVPEVIEHGKTGFVVNSIEEAAEVANRLGEIDRAYVRATFERRFSVEAMAMGYESAYRAVLGLVDGIRPERFRPVREGAILTPREVMPGEVPIAAALAAEAIA